MSRKNNNNDGNRIKSESITFRIDKNILEDLRDEAEQKMASINTLANQVLKTHVIWHKPAIKAGAFYAPKTLLTDIFEILTEEQMERITENWVKKYSKDMMIMINKEHNLTSFLDGFRVWLDLCNFQHTWNKKGDVEYYAIKFDMGKKFNLHMGKYLQFLFKELQVKDAEFEVTEYAVMFHFKER